MLAYATDGIILFLDADMQLLSDGTAAKIKQHFVEFPDTAVLGALIYSVHDEPMWYNWGYESSPKRDSMTEALNTIALAHWGNEAVMETVREVARGMSAILSPLKIGRSIG